MEGLSLKQAVDVLQQVRHYRICVHDVSGILTIPQLMLPVENTMHSMRFCCLAKDSAAGFRSCVRCKNISNHPQIITSCCQTDTPYGKHGIDSIRQSKFFFVNS